MSLETISYSEVLQAFMSFFSSKPKWYLNFNSKYYSFDSNNILRLHNSNNRYNVLSTIPTYPQGVLTNEFADKSVITFLTNQDYEATKTFDSVSYGGTFSGSNNLSNIYFITNTQTSNTVPFIERREDTYKFSIPRNNSDTLYADRMRGKYMLSNYEYDDINGSRFVLPYIKTTYRYSMI